MLYTSLLVQLTDYNFHKFVYLITTFATMNFDDVLMLYDCVCEWVPL